MMPNYYAGDILIKRVANGWIAVSSCEHGEGLLEVFVYEDPEEPNWVEKSLAALLMDQFRHYIQAKRKPGLKIEVTDLTREEEEDAKETHH